MITQLIIDTEFGNTGTPVRFVDWSTKERIFVELPNGAVVHTDAGCVSSGIHSPEETLRVLSRMSSIREDTLLKAAQSGRLIARKSGSTWLSTIHAVEWAISERKIRKPSGV